MGQIREPKTEALTPESSPKVGLKTKLANFFRGPGNITPDSKPALPPEQTPLNKSRSFW